MELPPEGQLFGPCLGFVFFYRSRRCYCVHHCERARTSAMSPIAVYYECSFDGHENFALKIFEQFSFSSTSVRLQSYEYDFVRLCFGLGRGRSDGKTLFYLCSASAHVIDTLLLYTRRGQFILQNHPVTIIMYIYINHCYSRNHCGDGDDRS